MVWKFYWYQSGLHFQPTGAITGQVNKKWQMIYWRKCPIFHQQKRYWGWGFNLCFLWMPLLSSDQSNRSHSASVWCFTPRCISLASANGAQENAPMSILYMENFGHGKVRWLAKYTQRLQQSWTHFLSSLKSISGSLHHPSTDLFTWPHCLSHHRRALPVFQVRRTQMISKAPWKCHGLQSVSY